MDQSQVDQSMDHGYPGQVDQSGKYPPGSRLFLGNLASEKTSREELHAIFSKYGPIVGNIALRRSFGFIQFETAEHAQAAMAAENGRIIGGIRLDIKLANSSEQKGGKGKRRREETGWDQGGPQHGGQQGPPKQRRGGGPPPRGPRGPPRGDNWGRQGGGGGGGGGWDNQGQYNDRGRGNWGNDGGNYDNWVGDGGNGHNYNDNNDQGWNQAPLCEVVYLGFDQGRYAGGIAQTLRDRLDISVDSYFIEKMTITDLFHDARNRGVRYVLLVGDQNEQQGTVNVNKLFRHGRPEAHRNVAQQDAMDMIAQGEGIPLRPPPLRSPPPQAYPPQQQHGGPQPAGVQPLMEAMGALLGNLQQQQPAAGQQPGAPNPLLLLSQALAQASTTGAPPNLNSLQGLLSSLQAQQNTLNTTQPPPQQQQVQQAYQPQTQPPQQQPQVQQAYQPQAQQPQYQQVPQQPHYQPQPVPQQQQVKPPQYQQQVPQQYAQQPAVVQQAQPQPVVYQQQPPTVVQQPPGVYAQPLPPQYTQQPQQLQQPLQIQPPVPGVVTASLQEAVEKFTAENL